MQLNLVTFWYTYSRMCAYECTNVSHYLFSYIHKHKHRTYFFLAFLRLGNDTRNQTQNVCIQLQRYFKNLNTVCFCCSRY